MVVNIMCGSGVMFTMLIFQPIIISFVEGCYLIFSSKTQVFTWS